MTTLNDFSVADLTIDVLAIYYNKLLGSIFRKEFSNAVAMSTDLTLTDGDTPIQRLNCNGANRIVKVAASAAGNHPYLLINTTSSGSWTLTVKSNDGTTVLKVLDPGNIGFFLPDGNGEYVEVGAGVSDHGALTGLADDDHTQYLLASGLREWAEQVSDPSTPASGKWKLYFKADGLHLIDDAGVVIGPILGRGTAMTPGGRLTLTSGTPVTTADVASSTSVYYTPYLHNKVPLWDGAEWREVEFSEQTLALGTVTSGLPYDVFGYLSAGALVLEKLAWTNGTTRATGISLQDGRYCKTGDKTRLYLGSFYTISTTQTADTKLKRLLFNAYHRKLRKLKVVEATDSWTYSTASWRSWNNSTANRVEILVGIADDLTEVAFNGVASNSAGWSMGHGIGLDSTSANSADTFTAAGSSGALVAGSAVYKDYLAVGFHYLQALEYGGGSGTTTFYGDANAAYIQCGIIGWCMG